MYNAYLPLFLCNLMEDEADEQKCGQVKQQAGQIKCEDFYFIELRRSISGLYCSISQYTVTLQGSLHYGNQVIASFATMIGLELFTILFPWPGS